MNAKSFFLTTTLVFIFLATISGCSESTKQAAPLPTLISVVNFPYIENNSLYSFEPETGLSEKLFTAEQELILALDTDQSSKEKNDNNVLIFRHSSKAEYFVYANTQTLHIYDVNTRINHQLYDFKNDIIFDPVTNGFVTAPESYICDIQKVVTWDKEPRLAKEVIYKDELAIYVKTSTNEECQNTETPFSYWQINIEETSETLSRRRRVLLEHSHDHIHFHDHDDDSYELAELHNHTHTLVEGELDENDNPFDPNNHKHNHKHIHGFLFEDEHGHDHLTKNEVDAVHNNSKNQEILFENHPKLIGRKTTANSIGGVRVDKIDEALMYSGKPVIDVDNRNFGYLGFNTSENTLKFYSVEDPDDKKLKKKLLWQLTNNSFNTIDNDQSKLSDLEKLIPRYNRFANFDYAEKDILIFTDTKVLFFTLADLFDDTLEDKEVSIANPIFTSNISTPKLSSRTNYSNSNKKMAITENNTIWSVDFSNNSPSQATRITQLKEPDLVKVDSTYISDSSILVEKSFNNNDMNESSIVVLQDTGLETQTVLPKTLDSISSIVINNDALINLTDASLQTRRVEYFSSELATLKPYYESIWGLDGVDYRNNNEQDIISIVSSETSSNEINSIASPKLYLFDNDDLLGQGEDFGYIPQDIIDVKNIVIFTDLYGFIEVSNIDSSTSTYFFSNKKTSFNFNSEYKNMKPLLAPTED